MVQTLDKAREARKMIDDSVLSLPPSPPRFLSLSALQRPASSDAPLLSQMPPYSPFLLLVVALVVVLGMEWSGQHGGRRSGVQEECKKRASKRER